MKRLTHQKAARLCGATLGLIILGGCAVTPVPFTETDFRNLNIQDQAQMFADQAPVTGAISLDEAIARALKYNLDHRVTLLEETLRSGLLDNARLDMLPRLTANAGYTSRNKDYLTVSRNTGTGDVSTAPSESQDRDRTSADLGLTWNILDFGVSYYNAQQQADQYLIAQERRQRVINQIVQDVSSLYWRAATLEKLVSDIQPVIRDTHSALNDSYMAESQRLMPPLEALRNQKGLLETLRDLELLEQELAITHIQLASIMNLPPGSHLSLQLPELNTLTMPKLMLTIEQMEELALQRRPELREEAYQQRITAVETRKALLRLLPGLSLNTGLNYDSNSYLVNNNWIDAGARVSWNLLNVLHQPAVKRAQEAQEEIIEARRLALAMTVLSQVHVGHQQLARAQQVYQQAEKLDNIEQRIYGHITQAVAENALSPLDHIQARLSAIQSEMNRYLAYAGMQNATANLYVSLGLSPLPDALDSHDLETVASAIRDVMASWQSGQVMDLME